VQILVSGNPCQCAAYCASGATSTADDEIFNVNIGTLNNTSNCSQTGGPGSILNRYSNYTGILAAPNLIGAATYTLNVTVGQCNAGAYSGGVTVYIDYNQNGLFSDPGEQVYASVSTLFAITGTTVTGVITIPASATPGITRMRVIAEEGNVGTAECATYTWGETEDYCIQIAAAVNCSGIPNAGTATISVTPTLNGCTGNPVSFTITVDNCASIDEITDDLLIVYPNPTSGSLSISGETLINYKSLEFIDASGRIVSKWTINGNPMNLDLSNFANGNYNLKIVGSDKIVLKKIQIKK
jgi:hypothetical protein